MTGERHLRQRPGAQDGPLPLLSGCSWKVAGGREELATMAGEAREGPLKFVVFKNHILLFLVPKNTLMAWQRQIIFHSQQQERPLLSHTDQARGG